MAPSGMQLPLALIFSLTHTERVSVTEKILNGYNCFRLVSIVNACTQ